MTEIHDTADLVSKALRRAWQLGQTYWQQADSEYPSQWKKADVTQATFNQLVADTRAALTSNSGAQPAPSVPDGWKLVPLEPTVRIRKAMHYAYWQRQSPQMPYHDGSPELWNATYAAMLAAAPKPEGE